MAIVRTDREVESDVADVVSALASMGAEEADLTRTTEALRAFWRARVRYRSLIWPVRALLLISCLVALVSIFDIHPHAGAHGIGALAGPLALWFACMLGVCVNFAAMRFIMRTIVNDSADVERFEVIRWATLAVASCGHAFGVSPVDRAVSLRWISHQCAGMEQALRKSHRTTQHTRYFSPRRKEIRVHAARVIGALRQAEAKLDSDPDGALRELAVMLVTISENYAAGKYTALLPEDQLEQARAARDWDRVWFLGAWILSLGLAWAVSQLDLPEIAKAPITLLATVSPFIARWGIEGGFSRFALTKGPQ
ncbi:hypothetical protein ACGF12_00720 [Kitasatospora sp. NPDC048296]|uniref:hypothetical protein n=1 Tax=Kitasatospora sp. NPDC048296 TaxID=3364048 RepID=UPI0037114F58